MAPSDPVLPPPATASDLYLVAIHDVLRQIRDQLTGTAGAPTVGAPVELREPDFSAPDAEVVAVADEPSRAKSRPKPRTRRSATK